MEHAQWARDLAQRLLAEPLPRRWSHTQGVGRKAESIAHIVGRDANVLIRAAWLHDIGYSPSLVKSGLHQIDGARYLRNVAEASDLVCRLVAYHSCGTVEARNRGLADQLADEFAPVDGLLADALTYSDMTTSPDGEPIDVETRLKEILTRYGDGDLVAESIREASPHIVRSVQAVASILAAPGAR